MKQSFAIVDKSMTSENNILNITRRKPVAEFLTINRTFDIAPSKYSAIAQNDTDAVFERTLSHLKNWLIARVRCMTEDELDKRREDLSQSAENQNQFEKRKNGKAERKEAGVNSIITNKAGGDDAVEQMYNGRSGAYEQVFGDGSFLQYAFNEKKTKWAIKLDTHVATDILPLFRPKKPVRFIYTTIIILERSNLDGFVTLTISFQGGTNEENLDMEALGNRMVELAKGNIKGVKIVNPRKFDCVYDSTILECIAADTDLEISQNFNVISATPQHVTYESCAEKIFEAIYTPSESLKNGDFAPAVFISKKGCKDSELLALLDPKINTRYLGLLNVYELVEDLCETQGGEETKKAEVETTVNSIEAIPTYMRTKFMSNKDKDDFSAVIVYPTSEISNPPARDNNSFFERFARNTERNEEVIKGYIRLQSVGVLPNACTAQNGCKIYESFVSFYSKQLKEKRDLEITASRIIKKQEHEYNVLFSKLENTEDIIKQKNETINSLRLKLDTAEKNWSKSGGRALQASLSAANKRIDALVAETDELYKQLDNVGNQVKRVTAEKEKLLAKVEEQKETAANTEAAHQAEIELKNEEIVHLRNMLSRPTSVDGISQWVKEQFTGRLLLAPEALSTLKNEATNYRLNMTILCDALEYLAEEYWECLNGIIDVDKSNIRCSKKYNRPFTVTPNSQYTINTFPKEYYINYKTNCQANRRALDLHLSAGVSREDNIRIYFFYDKEKKLIVIGSMPKHLSTLS